MDALLSTFGIDWHLLLVQSVNFAVLAVALTWLLYKPVLNMVKEREQVIAKGVSDAEEAANKLLQADGEAAVRLSAADKEAGGIVENARHAGTEERARIVKEAEERAARIASDAQVQALETAARAKRDSEREVARLAILAAEKVLKERHD
jgi:F-type H+-transporting ATPase subunit b